MSLRELPKTGGTGSVWIGRWRCLVNQSIATARVCADYPNFTPQPCCVHSCRLLQVLPTPSRLALTNTIAQAFSARNALSHHLRHPAFRRFLSQDARTKIQSAVQESPVVLFMKGNPQMPQCGFSRAAVQILDIQGVPEEKLKTFDVLEDSELRSDIKEFS